MNKSQTLVYNYIKNYYDTYGISPTLTEISLELGKSKNAISNTLSKLKAKGWVDYEKYGRRNYVIDIHDDLCYNEDVEKARQQIVFYRNEIKRLNSFIESETDKNYERKLKKREYMREKRRAEKDGEDTCGIYERVS